MAKTTEKKRATKKEEITRGGILLRLLINAMIIIVLGVLAAVATHFILQSATRHGVRRSVPDLNALTIEEAEQMAASYDLQLIINDSLYAPTHERGTILDQLPEEGTIVKPGRTIYVTINATQQKMVAIPYVAGRSLRQAKNMLEVAGLTIDYLTYERDLATNYILSQSYNGKEIEETSNLKAPVGAGIALTVGVSEGQELTAMPQLIGSSLHVAKSALWSAGLNVRAVKYEDGIDESNSKLAVVIEQSYPADSLLRLGRAISFKMTLDHEKVNEYFEAIEKEQKFREKMEREEKALADSLAQFAIDSAAIEITKPKAEKVEFEDLFN